MDNKELIPENTSISSQEIDNKITSSQFNQLDTYDKLNEHLNTQDKQQKTVEKARQLLGKDGNSLTDEESYNLYTEIKFLTDSWVEEFERGVFNGKSLKELLGVDT